MQEVPSRATADGLRDRAGGKTAVQGQGLSSSLTRTRDRYVHSIPPRRTGGSALSASDALGLAAWVGVPHEIVQGTGCAQGSDAAFASHGCMGMSTDVCPLHHEEKASLTFLFTKNRISGCSCGMLATDEAEDLPPDVGSPRVLGAPQDRPSCSQGLSFTHQ